MKKKASELLGVSTSTLVGFDVIDTFNPTNRLKGMLCRQSDHRYGALVILEVNGVSCEQIIWATPKLIYPFNKMGEFNWPDIDKLSIWEKLDGTNILSYQYTDENGEIFTTYKTRLTPVIQKDSFGSFDSLWIEYSENNLWIDAVINANPAYHLSFELWGSRNPITVSYDSPLEVTLLFGISKDGHNVVPPSALNLPKGTKIPESFEYNGSDLTEFYNSNQIQLSKRNTEGNILTEGTVFYAQCEDDLSWLMFKCKTPEVEKIHFNSGGIPKYSLWTTAINSFEHVEGTPTYDDYLSLLKEEYTDEQLERSKGKLKNVFNEAVIHVNTVSKVNEVWKKARDAGFDISADRGGTMRFISQFFSKSEMRKVGTMVLSQAGLFKKK